jgi:hypothetical protein
MTKSVLLHHVPSFAWLVTQSTCEQHRVLGTAVTAAANLLAERVAAINERLDECFKGNFEADGTYPDEWYWRKEESIALQR